MSQDKKFKFFVKKHILPIGVLILAGCSGRYVETPAVHQKVVQLKPSEDELSFDNQVEHSETDGFKDRRVMFASVAIFDEYSRYVLGGETDEKGEFVGTDLKPGKYDLIVSDPGSELIASDTLEIPPGSSIGSRAMMVLTVLESQVLVSISFHEPSLEESECGDVVLNDAELARAARLAMIENVSVDEVVELREESCAAWEDIAEMISRERLKSHDRVDINADVSSVASI